jgi:hypothetical protein
MLINKFSPKLVKIIGTLTDSNEGFCRQTMFT